MKIVVLDGYCENPGDISWNDLYKLGEVTIYDRTPNDKEEIIKRIGDSDIVITNKTPIDKTVLDATPNLKFISVLATGYNIVDINYARSKNIPVSNVPHYGTMAVSQFAFGLLFELCHHISYHNDEVKNGRWSSSLDFCFYDYPIIELANKTIGIIGLGNIGKQSAKIAKSLGMNVLAYTRTPKKEDNEFANIVSLDTLFSCSDVIMLHCPLTEKTKGIINKEAINKMKDGVILINNSRGALLVEEDVANALNEGKILGAGLDVVSVEPIKDDNPLLKAKNCIITPHISWAAKECRLRIMNQTVNNIIAFINGSAINVVN